MRPLPGISGEPSTIRLVLRFGWVAMLTSIAATFLAHLLIPQADPARPVDPAEPAEIALGIGVWCIILLVPTLDLLRTRRRFFSKVNPVSARRCPACGYDLRATPDRCPECGTVSADFKYNSEE